MGLLQRTLDNIDIQEIIEGEARGADTLARIYGETIRKVSVRKFPADWTTFGKRAGPIRNHQMLKDGRPDLVVAFLAPNSRGTKHMIDIAQKAGVKTLVIDI